MTLFLKTVSNLITATHLCTACVPLHYALFPMFYHCIFLRIVLSNFVCSVLISNPKHKQYLRDIQLIFYMTLMSLKIDNLDPKRHFPAITWKWRNSAIWEHRWHKSRASSELRWVVHDEYTEEIYGMETSIIKCYGRCHSSLICSSILGYAVGTMVRNARMPSILPLKSSESESVWSQAKHFFFVHHGNTLRKDFRIQLHGNWIFKTKDKRNLSWLTQKGLLASYQSTPEEMTLWNKWLEWLFKLIRRKHSFIFIDMYHSYRIMGFIVVVSQVYTMYFDHAHPSYLLLSLSPSCWSLLLTPNSSPTACFSFCFLNLDSAYERKTWYFLSERFIE